MILVLLAFVDGLSVGVELGGVDDIEDEGVLIVVEPLSDGLNVVIEVMAEDSAEWDVV